jgi:hypothetical protein
VNLAIESQSPGEQPQRVDVPLPNLLAQGFQLALRNWPLLVWAYAVNLVFGLLAAIPFTTGLSPFLDHSLAAERIAGTVDVSYILELVGHLHRSSFASTVIHTGTWLNLLQLLVLFVVYAGTTFVYVSAEPPRLSVLLRGGIAYFWRFVRAAVLAGCIAAVILGILLTLRGLLLHRAGEVYVERTMFLYSAISGVVVLLVAALVRVWWDVVEVYIVRNAMDGERRVRQALLPALRLLWRYFFRTVGSFLLVGIAGFAALALCMLLWNQFVPAHQVWLAFVVAQLGLFLLLSSRFWQRGIEAALVMSADPPMVAREEIAALVEEVDDEDAPVAAIPDSLVGLSEPTLRELVQKLRTEPWATPDTGPSAPLRPLLEPTQAPGTPKADDPQGSVPQGSILDRHATKFPLGGVNPEAQAEQPTANPGDKPGEKPGDKPGDKDNASPPPGKTPPSGAS